MTKRTKRAILWSVIGVVVALAAFAAYYFTALYNQVDNFQKEGEQSPFYNVQPTETKVPEPPKWEGKDRVNILLMGVDARGLKKGKSPLGHHAGRFPRPCEQEGLPLLDFA